jgi:nitroreductase
MGMFIQNVMLAARGFGLETCPQAALAEYPDIVRSILSLPDALAVICGMALGYPDMTLPVNQYRLSRAAVADFTRWYD